ncbi:lysozyme [Noviluteimonas gilva]|uniref:Lysozyme n=1 Tax=Noviluteimonas gilva TaxID=2682097 RepID=A0A7C9HR32_9GAMM|nr:lysozyme [Lysobacter gilvus]MUV13573.1 glycoside hydrolase family protein [Lysobacter gilvus]
MSKAKVGAASAVVLLLAGGLIAKWEGVRYEPYQDVVGVWTVCYGSTTNVDPSRKYTRAECEARLDADMRVADSAVRRCVGRDMPDGVRASLISLVFNVGPKPVCQGSPGKFARAGDWPNTCKSLDLYKFAGGRVFRGLVLRRADERKVCEGR